MIKKIFTFCLVLTAITLKAEIGDWTLYPAYNNATYCQIADDKVYILASGALYSYNKDDNEVRLYDKINTLSDIDITHIAYSKDIKALVIVYSNANIDILYNDDEIYNLTDFKNKILPKKRINNINIQGTTAYLSTEFGVVEIDLENLEFNNTYNTGLNTYSTIILNNKIYCATDNGLYIGDTSNNLLDKNNWNIINNNIIVSLCETNGEIYCIAKGGKVFE